MRMQTFFGRPVSSLGFGAMRLPKKDDAIDQEAANRLIRTALDHGVNYFDTAYGYGSGANERALSAALRASGYPRDAYMVASKMPFWSADSHEYLEETFQKTLENLGTGYVDFYLMHAMNAELFEKVERFGAIEWVNEKKRLGQIRHVGFSIHDTPAMLRKILDANAWDFTQIQLNFLDEKDNPGLEGYEELCRRNIPIVIMEPMKGGTITNLPASLTAPFTALGNTAAHYGFRWLCEKPGIMTILSGMNADAQLEENLAIFDDPQPLTGPERAAVAEVCENVHAALHVSCTGCGYCQPCPAEIKIPDVFHLWNRQALQGKASVNPERLQKALDQAQSCLTCRACESRCPQHIPIPDKLAEFVAENV